ncbi:unnamed protein product [Lampetra planeri]
MRAPANGERRIRFKCARQPMGARRRLRQPMGARSIVAYCAFVERRELPLPPPLHGTAPALSEPKWRAVIAVCYLARKSTRGGCRCHCGRRKMAATVCAVAFAPFFDAFPCDFLGVRGGESAPD